MEDYLCGHPHQEFHKLRIGILSTFGAHSTTTSVTYTIVSLVYVLCNFVIGIRNLSPVVINCFTMHHTREFGLFGRESY